MEGEPYRCSSGIMINSFNKYHCDRPHLILSESDPATRNTLRNQLVKEGFDYCIPLENATEIANIPLNNIKHN